MGLEVIIEEGLLLSLLEAARRKYPLEVLVFLGGREEGSKVYITEVLYIPWREGFSHAEVFLDHIPFGEVIGTFHSHPGSPIPSKEDLMSFPSLGKVHIIAGYPFSLKDVRAYDARGRRIKLRVGQRASF